MDQSTPMDVTASTEKDSSRDSAQRPQESPPRHSPAPPLAPLEFLQNQRRGSITDPSLHAASPNPQNNSAVGLLHSSASSAQHRHQDFPHPGQSISSSDLQDSQSKNTHTTRPVSPYIFGDASVVPSETPNNPSRRVSQKSSLERGNNREMTQTQNGQHATRKEDSMDIDAVGKPNRKHSIDMTTSNTPGQFLNFDYSKRRHSVTGGESGRSPSHSGQSLSRRSPISPASQAGAKRKTSSDRGQLPSVGEEIDPQLVGPGTHSSLAVDSDEPSPKRRNSAFDTQRMAHLTLYDRRDSSDSRMSGTPTFWGPDRRDSSSSMFSGTSLASSVGFNSPAFAADAHGRQPGSMATFAWPPNSGPGDHPEPPGLQAVVDPSLTRQFEGQVSPHATIPSTNMPLDRRMSVPDSMPSSSSTRPERVLRSRSRPPSRSAAVAARAGDTTGNSSDISPGGARPDELSSTSPSQHLALPKESGATPYSRSPELRVSHKLAERKRRKEMRDLFDELRDQLPADRGMKASKWEILSKAIDFIQQMKATQQDMSREIDVLRHELDAIRHGVPFGHPGAPHAVLYGPPQFAHPPPPPPQPIQPQPMVSRPGSSQNSFAPGSGPPPATNGKTGSTTA